MRSATRLFRSVLLGSAFCAFAASAHAGPYTLLYNFAGPPNDGSYPYNDVSFDAGGGSLGGTFDQAFLWYGTAASAVNLNNLLPSPGPWLESEALTVDANGNIFGFAIGTYDNSYGIYAVEWSVPEPASASLLLLAAPVMLMRRRKKPQTQHRRILLLEPI